jgi:mxaA protein
MIKPISTLSQTLLVMALLFISFNLHAVEEGHAKVLQLTNPAKSYGVQIGDKLTRKVVLEVPAPLTIADANFPKKGTKNKGIELVDVAVTTSQQKDRTIYTFSLGYQTFNSTNKPTVMQLPVEKFVLTGAEKPENIEIAAWGFWFSPIVAGGVDTAQKNIQPELMPPMLNIEVHQIRLALFLSLFIFSLIALLYMNADGHWLPFMGGAFAKAHRQLKRLAQSSVAKTVVEEKQALVNLHQAFNQHFGANMFARDIEHFVGLRPSFSKVQSKIAQFFDESNQSLYSIEPRDSQKMIVNLVQLSKELRDSERGV